MLRINKFLFAVIAASSVAYAAYAAVTDITQTEYTYYDSGSKGDSSSRTSTFSISEPSASSETETQTPMMRSAAAPAAANVPCGVTSQPYYIPILGFNPTASVQVDCSTENLSVTVNETNACANQFFYGHPYNPNLSYCDLWIQTAEYGACTLSNKTIQTPYCACPNDYQTLSYWSDNTVPVVTVTRSGSTITKVEGACYWDAIAINSVSTIKVTLGSSSLSYLSPVKPENLSVNNTALNTSLIRYSTANTAPKCSSISAAYADGKTASQLVAAQNDSNHTFSSEDPGSSIRSEGSCAHMFTSKAGYEKAKYYYCSANTYKYSSSNCTDSASGSKTLRGNSCKVTGMDKPWYTKCLDTCVSTNEPVVSSSSECKTGAPYGTPKECYDVVKAADSYLCTCSSNAKTLEQYCSTSSDPNCSTKMFGIGECDYESPSKYANFYASCDWYKSQVSGFELTVFSTSTSCKIDEYDEVFDDCRYPSNSATAMKVCRCPENFKTKTEYCTDVVTDKEIDFNGAFYTQESCEAAMIGIGSSCTYDSAEEQFASFMAACPENAITASSESGCATGKVVGHCYDSESGTPMYLCGCPTNYKTLDEYCETKVSEGTETSVEVCKNHYIGIDQVCTSETDAAGNVLQKYVEFGERCSYYKTLANNAELDYKDTAEDCTFDGSSNADLCYNDKDTPKYICRCPDNYQTLTAFCQQKVSAGETDAQNNNATFTQTSCEAKFIGINTACIFDDYDSSGATSVTMYKYKDFSTKCSYYDTLASGITLTKVTDASSCVVGTTPTNNADLCYNDATTLSYVCRCPENWKTLAEYCAIDLPSDSSCTSTHSGFGNACTYDGSETKTKYSSYMTSCPIDRDLFNTEAECINGDVDYHCVKEGKEYVVCGCKDGYQTVEEYCSSSVTGKKNDFANNLYTADTCAADYIGQGTACTFDKQNTYKYNSFLPKCPSIRPVKTTSAECNTYGSELSPCYDKDAKSTKYVCQCSSDFRTKTDFCAQDINGKGIDFTGKTYTADTCAADYISQGDSCNYDSNTTLKYKTFIQTCPTHRPTVYDKSSCKLSNEQTANVFAECIDRSNNKKYVCSCPSGFKTLQKYCEELYPSGTDADILLCLNNYEGNAPACIFDNSNETKYGSFLGGCPDGYKLFTTTTECIKAGATINSCKINGTTMYYCLCEDGWITLDTYCQNLVSSGVPYNTCITGYVGTGTSCALETEALKYAPNSFYPICSADRTTYNSQNDCKEGDGVGKFEGNCATSDGKVKYLCSCNDGFMTLKEYCAQKVENQEKDIYGNKYTQSSCEATYIGVGDPCYMEGATPQYKTFNMLCPSNAETVNSIDDCGNVGELNYVCVTNSGNDKFVCKCKSNFITKKEYCQRNNLTEAECNEIQPSGQVCTFDGENKYGVFASVCPSNRPLFTEGTNCADYNGEFDYNCEHNGEIKVVCKCPSSFIENGRCTSSTEEVSGKTCNLDNKDIIKYEFCRTTCSTLSANGSIYYNYSTEAACKAALGDGATFGTNYADQKCSENNELKTPCYCGKSYQETCLTQDLKVPDPDALLCRVNNVPHYEYCLDNSCSPETSLISVIKHTNPDQTPTEACIAAGFGSGIIGSLCGLNQIECYCNPEIYDSTCDVPYQKPYLGTVKWCKAGENGLKMTNGEPHFRSQDCLTKLDLAPCGQYIVDENDGKPNYNYTIQVVDSSAACTSMYGTGASAQLCEYLDIPGKRAYNCYYNPSEFIWTEYNCPVRHVFGDNYIIKNGTRYYDRCDCHTAYKYHQYNCGGTLSGRACSQILSNSKVREDSTLQHAVNYNLLEIGDNLSFYAYCSCSDEYNQTCNGPNEVGVGAPCNGKYKSCICEPDPIPDNWTDSYYGCPEGQKPTGVIKPNGCGGKYYQCKAVECTWQHTEKCLSPLIGIDPCQDNSGNVVAYRSCRCPDGYVQCPNGYVGEGIPCMLNGQYYYKEKDCVEKNTCSRNQSATCHGAFQLGINPCEKNGETYFEYCSCANGFDKTCNGENEIGIGEFCELDGIKYYKECKTPYPSCTSEHKYVCDTNQTSFDPCVNADNDIMYKCRCPANWQKCLLTGPVNPLESCTDENGTVYSACAATKQCTEYQINSYSICTQTEIGMGGSCSVVDSEGNELAIMHAKCEPTSDCAANGYKYTCLTHDEFNLGDYCVDINGNRLYKSCSCPTGYVGCTGENNIYGTPCTPINEQGKEGDTLYSSCTCNKSIYRYQCEKTATNQGVIPLDEDYCQENIYGEDRQPLLYRACGCEDEYKFTCSLANQIGDEEDYCDTGNGPKLYKSCSCPEGWTTCPSDTNLKGTACTPTNPDGTDGTTVYQTCNCDDSYKYSCGLEDDGSGIEYSATSKYNLSSGYCSTIKDGVTQTRYQKCECSSSYIYTCSGETLEPVNPSDYCTRVRENGATQKLYKECKCSTERNVSGYYDGLLSVSENTDLKTQLCSDKQLKDSKLREIVTAQCKYAGNANFITNGCGQLYFKCREDNPKDETCSNNQEATSYESGFCGERMWVKSCGCDRSDYPVTQVEQCTSAYKTQRSINITCTDSSSSVTSPYTSSNQVNCDKLQFELGYETCVESGTTYYQCLCAQPSSTLDKDPNSCISSYCGNPSNNNTSIACWQGSKRIGVLIINGNKDVQDKACQNHRAKIYSELPTTEGAGEPGEEITVCEYQT